MKAVNYKKIFQTLNYFAIKEDGTINRLKALKLIWLSDRLHLRLYGRTITGDTYYALKNGPVPSMAKNFSELNLTYLEDSEYEYGKNIILPIGKYDFKSLCEIEKKVFSQSDLTVMDAVLSDFGNKEWEELTELSHNFPEWKKFESGLISNYRSRYVMDLNDFLLNPDINYPIFNQSKELLEFAESDLKIFA